LSKWKEQFIQGGKSALAKMRNSDSRNEEINDLKKIIGDLSLVIDNFKKGFKGGQDDGY
jgi:hypothetical protein